MSNSIVHYACPAIQCEGPFSPDDGKTGAKKNVTCDDCKHWLYVYETAFPPGSDEIDLTTGRR